MELQEKLKKPHWIRLLKKLAEYGNGRCVIVFQDELPITIIEIEGRRKDIDLTKESKEESKEE